MAGKAADDIGIQTGGWTISWQGAAGATTTGTTILQGIRNAAPSAAVTYSRLGDVATGTQAAVVVIGELPYAEMKGDRVSLELDPDDVAVVKKVKQSGVPTVVVLPSGRPHASNIARGPYQAGACASRASSSTPVVSPGPQGGESESPGSP